MTPNPLRHSLIAITAAAALSACQAPDAATPAAPATAAVRPVSTTLPAEPPAADTAAITDRFTTTIWPATVDYHYHPSQNGPEQLRWTTTIDPALTAADYTALRQGVQNLGVLTPDTPGSPGTAGVENLQLGSTSVATATDATATISACYTFTALNYTVESGYDQIKTPAAAQADFTLTHTDTWQLHAITNQRAVPGC